MMTRLAFNNASGELFQLSEEMVERGVKASRESERKRMILPIHRKQEAEVQRMLNFLQPGTYIRPHMHPLNHATESLVILQGSIRFYTFDDSGAILSTRGLKSKPMPAVLDIEPQVWHSFLVLEEDTILFECKKGPYNAETDKTFASWSPEEGCNAAWEWMNNL